MKELSRTIYEILYKVNEAEVFSEIGLAHGYHQIAFDEKSRDITTLLHFKDISIETLIFLCQKCVWRIPENC